MYCVFFWQTLYNVSFDKLVLKKKKKKEYMDNGFWTAMYYRKPFDFFSESFQIRGNGSEQAA